MRYSSVLLALTGLLPTVFGTLDVSTGDGVAGISKYNQKYSWTNLCGDAEAWRNETTNLSPLRADCQEIWQIMADSPSWVMFANIGEWKDKNSHGLFPLVTVRTCTFAIRPWGWWEPTTARMYVGSSDLNDLFHNAPNDQGSKDRVGTSGTMKCKEPKSGEPERDIFFRIYNPNDQHPADFGDSW
ncbi:hypothetical protein SCUP515_00262 [Seiridium cupressi]